MRLFLAVDLDDAVRRIASGAASRVRRALAARDAHAVKWVDAANLHVTMHFLGEVAEPDVPALRRALAAPLPFPCFDVGLGGLGVFPPRGQPRVLWMGITPGAAALSAAHRALGDRLGAMGMAVDDRPFQAHVTLARVKQPIGEDLRALAAGVPADPSGVCRVESVTLYRSWLGSRGPTYEVQMRTPLEGR